jgi:ketosteroid isomerase-like protein
MSFTIRNGKVAIFREYTDTKVLADAYESAAHAAG